MSEYLRTMVRNAMPKFEKRPGPDWLVNIFLDDEIFGVTVFGAKDEAEAIRDALSSFSHRDQSELTVISVVRDDELGNQSSSC